MPYGIMKIRNRLAIIVNFVLYIQIFYFVDKSIFNTNEIIGNAYSFLFYSDLNGMSLTKNCLFDSVACREEMPDHKILNPSKLLFRNRTQLTQPGEKS